MDKEAQEKVTEKLRQDLIYAPFLISYPDGISLAVYLVELGYRKLPKDKSELRESIRKILRNEVSVDVQVITDRVDKWETYTGQMQEGFVGEITKRILALIRFIEKEG